MTIGVAGRVIDDTADDVEIGGISWLRFSQTVSIDFRFRVDLDSSEYPASLADEVLSSPRADFIGPVRRDFMIHVDGDILFAFDDGRAIGINRSHPIFSTTLKSWGYTLDGVDRVMGKSDAFRQDSGILWLDDAGIDLSPERRFRRLRGMVQAEHTIPGLSHAVRSIIDLGNLIVLPLFRAFSETFRCTMVPASRTIPSSENLAFLLERSKVGEDHPWFHIGAKGDARYRKLAMAFARQLSEKNRRGLARNYVDQINKMLTSHLFGERGYFIGMDYRVVLTGDDLQRIRSNKQGDIQFNDYAMLVRLFLTDSEGRHYSFSEVGSGLGYVFPVLCELCDPNSRMVQLQQPELHLHPAMQSGLGDVLLDTVKLHSNLIVETHSEHLLLRILKRIRQRKYRDTKDLSANDIAVLYFEPKEKGTTDVHQLRISDDGDFIDKWPRGFFMERDAELWDE